MIFHDVEKCRGLLKNVNIIQCFRRELSKISYTDAIQSGEDLSFELQYKRTNLTYQLIISTSHTSVLGCGLVAHVSEQTAAEQMEA